MNSYLMIFTLSFFAFTNAFANIPTQLQQTSAKKILIKLTELEEASGGRIGVSAINMANGMRLQYHAEERFPMGCTSKVMGVAAILKKSMEDKGLLQEKVRYKKDDLVSWSPMTGKHLNEGMTVAQLCEAAITLSDNSAMNLLVKKMGGLQAMNAFARSIDDQFFRVDNDWPKEALSGGPGNLYDSSTPAAMEKSLQQLAFGNVLTPSLREQLLAWLKSNTTGDARIRAGVPKGWIVADKTGTGSNYGTTNDIGIIWPPQCAPIVMAIYFTQNKKEAAKQEEVIASTTRILVDEFAGTDQCIKARL